MRFRLSGFLAGALLACQTTAPEPEPTAAPNDVASSEARVPESVQVIVRGWRAQVETQMRAAAKDHRAGPAGQWRWTDAERAALEAAQAQAQTTIAEASDRDRPWLLFGYASAFFWFGIGSDYADAVVAIPPENPAWPSLGPLLGLAREASDPAALEACVHAVAELHDAPFIDAESLFLRLREADRRGDWDLAFELVASIDAIEIGPPTARRSIRSTFAGSPSVDIDTYDPGRMLRTATPVPEFCTATLIGDVLERRCLTELFPHPEPTLIVGSASWCSPCRETMPKVITAARTSGSRVIVISYDESVEQAKAYRSEYGIEDAAFVLPLLDGIDRPVSPGDLEIRSIPYVALVDGQGMVEVGPPWVDLDALR